MGIGMRIGECQGDRYEAWKDCIFYIKYSNTQTIYITNLYDKGTLLLDDIHSC